MSDKKQMKGIFLIAGVVVIGLALILISGSSFLDLGESKNTIKCADYEKSVEEELAMLISKLDGVSGNVYVMVTSYGDFEKGKSPEIRGVAVICSVNASLKVEIINLVSSVLGISSARIYVGNRI